MNCVCGRELKGGIDTYGTLDKPMCQSCWLDKAAEQLTQVAEQEKREAVSLALYLKIEACRNDVRDIDNSIDLLKKLRWQTLRQMNEYEYELAKLDDFFGMGMEEKGA